MVLTGKFRLVHELPVFFSTFSILVWIVKLFYITDIGAMPFKKQSETYECIIVIHTDTMEGNTGVCASPYSILIHSYSFLYLISSYHISYQIWALVHR